MLRRLFYSLLFLGFLALSLGSAYFLRGRYDAWQGCADTWGRCHDAATGLQLLEPTGIAMAYGSFTFVLALLTLWSLTGMLRSRRRRVYA